MPRIGPRSRAALVLALLSVGVLLIAPSSPAAAAPVQIQLLAINDFHGRLQADATAGVPGAARVAGLIDEVSAEGPTGFAAAGDLIGASPFVSAVAQDQPTIDVLNEMGLDVSSVGNHEFDRGWTDLRDRVIPAANWQYLGANVRDNTTDERVLDAYYVETIGGVDVGYVGVVTGETPSLVSPAGISTLTFTDPVAEAEDVAADLKDGDEANGEADIVVVLTHEGAGPANIGSPEALANDPVFGEFVAMSADVDAIFSAHTHQAYAFEVPIPGTERLRPVLSAQEYGKKVGRTKLTVDPTTGDVAIDVVELLDPSTATPDPAVEALVAQAEADSVVLGAEKVGEIDADVLRGGTPPGADRGVESDLNNFVADALLHGSTDPGRGNADLAIMNPGGLREDLRFAAGAKPGDAEGVVTYSEAFDVQPFANDVVTVTLTGAQLADVLEEQWQPASASRPVLWLGVSSGFSYTYNPAAPTGLRINDASLALNGTPIGPDDELRVTMNSFLAAGGDNFFTLAEGTNSTTTGDNDLVFLVNYFRSFDGGDSPAAVDREPRSFVAVPENPDLGPFATVQDAVARQFEDFAGRQPTAEERFGWEFGIYAGNRTLAQLVLELQSVDLRSPEAQIARLYLGLFDRPPSVADLEYWVGEMEAGRGIRSITAFFARSAEFKALYGPDVTDAEFIELVYQNVLKRAATDADLAYWTGELAAGKTRADVFVSFAESPENRARTAPHLRAIDLVISMLGRSLTKAELRQVTEALESGEHTFSDMIDELIHSDEYAATVVPSSF